MTNYMICADDGTKIADGMTHEQARRFAREEANRLGECVYIHADGSDDEPQEIRPSPAAVIRRQRDESSRCWEQAVDTAASESQSDALLEAASTCLGAYDTALSLVRDGRIADARSHLELARQFESDGGDDRHAATALEALAVEESP